MNQTTNIQVILKYMKQSKIFESGMAITGF